jgi:hypothetical protein
MCPGIGSWKYAGRFRTTAAYRRSRPSGGGSSCGHGKEIVRRNTADDGRTTPYRDGITSERRLMEEVRMHLAYRWFARLGFEREIPDHLTFSENRHGGFRDSF